MKLTRTRLRRLIKEEISRTLEEAAASPAAPAGGTPWAVVGLTPDGRSTLVSGGPENVHIPANIDEEVWSAIQASGASHVASVSDGGAFIEWALENFDAENVQQEIHPKHPSYGQGRLTVGSPLPARWWAYHAGVA